MLPRHLILHNLQGFARFATSSRTVLGRTRPLAYVADGENEAAGRPFWCSLGQGVARESLRPYGMREVLRLTERYEIGAAFIRAGLGRHACWMGPIHGPAPGTGRANCFAARRLCVFSRITEQASVSSGGVSPEWH